MLELQHLAPKLPWTNPLEVWKMNNSLKKKRSRKRGPATPKAKQNDDPSEPVMLQSEPEKQEKQECDLSEKDNSEKEVQDSEIQESEAKPLKFRVTCNRAGDKHSFTSNDAARDFGGAVQEFFQWKADMTKFDVEVGCFVNL